MGEGEERREEWRGDISSNEAFIICHENTNASIRLLMSTEDEVGGILGIRP